MTTTASARPPTTTPPTTTPARSSRIWSRWMLTALAFPPAGYIAYALVGRVDGVVSAGLNGVITGALLGLAQWALLRRRGVSTRWIGATAAGFGVGLAAGGLLVSFATSLGALVAMGAVTGLVVGIAQLAVVPSLRRHGGSWAVLTAALWAIGWAVTTGAGIAVTDQFPVFGISGAIVVAVLQALMMNRFVPAVRTDGEVADHV